MAISADMVKKLREQTGAGMMDCKKALTETDGDYEKAIAILREKGIAVAAKREARSASEGIIAVYSSDDAQIGVMVELNCETTFVAKTDEFIALANNIAAHIGNTSPELSDLENLESVLTQKYYADPQHTIQDLINNNIAKLGEKTTLGRFVRVDVGGEEHERNGAIGTYIHMGNQIGVMVELNCENKNSKKVKWYGVERTNGTKAVQIVAIVGNKLVVTKEYRYLLVGYEWGLPAGLIDANENAVDAAIRELKEETGLYAYSTFKDQTPFIYNSAGMTNESICIVYLKAKGELSQKFLESDEDIETFLMSRKQVKNLLIRLSSDPDCKELIGAKSWLIMDRFVKHGDF